MEASVLSNGLRNVVVVFVMLGLLATACTEESRDKIREALPSGVSGLPSLSPRPTGPTGGESGEPTAPTGPTESGEPTAPTGPTGPVETPTEEPTEPPTESPAEPTEGPGSRTGRVDPGDHRHPRGTRRATAAHRAAVTDRDPIARGDHRTRGRDRHGTDGGATGVTGAVTGPTGPTGATGSAEGDASADVVQAAASSTTESSAWVLFLFLAVLGGVIGYLWWRARRGRAHHG